VCAAFQRKVSKKSPPVKALTLCGMLCGGDFRAATTRGIFNESIGSCQLDGLEKLLPKVSRRCGYDFATDGTCKFDRAILREAKRAAATDRR